MYVSRVPTLIGKTDELAGAYRMKYINICALQESRWYGAQNCDIERERC